MRTVHSHVNLTEVAMLVVDDMGVFVFIINRCGTGVVLDTDTGVSWVYRHRCNMGNQVQKEGGTNQLCR